ncbi:MAG: protein kinase, partial [Planctomycetes bacterium]|nr:protein kinase [Planctomycetota bacterium]
MGGKRARRRQLISDRIALYKTEEDLGAWGAGQGRWVYDEQDKEHFVFVTIPPEALPNSRARRAFKRQLEHSQGLDHPRIVAILKGGTDDGDGRPYLIQEPTSGRTLERALQAGERFTPAGALQVAVDVLNGLAYAHSRGRIEGGLSPRSVLISGEGDLARGRILTFGFPRLVGEAIKTPVGELFVDSECAAPEVIKGEPVDGRADVYSVGALLYRMLTGEPAVSVEGSKDPVLHRLNQTAAELPEGTFDDPERDEAVRVALRRALAKAPSRRPTARGFALLLAGQSDEGERFSEVLPDGGTCSASGDAIPPFAERPWDRKLSDRPFRCRTTGGYFAGKAHWDSRTLTSSKGADKSLPEPDSAPPEDVVLAQDEKTSADRDAAARMRAMHELITSSKEQRPTRNVADDRAAKKPRAEDPGRSSDVVRTALIDAWEHDRRGVHTARLRSGGKPDAPVEPEVVAPRRETAPVLPPLGRRLESAALPRATTQAPTGWALITTGLLLLSLFLGWTFSDERGKRIQAESERESARESLEEATKVADANATEALDLRGLVVTLRGERDGQTQAVADALAARDQALEASEGARRALQTLTAELDAARGEAATSIAALESAK